MRLIIAAVLTVWMAFPSYGESAVDLWQKAREEMLAGEAASTKEVKKAHFSKGVEYANRAIEADPKNPDCYMWHSANVGRLCQTQSLPEQAKAVPVMIRDLTMILETLGYQDYFEAWQALSEIYYNHPFKSSDSAICFTRKALSNFPPGNKEPYIYDYLANALYKRNWSAEKRASHQKKEAREFAKEYKSVIDKYAHYDGVASCGRWSSKPFGSMSDREEAEAIRKFISTLK